MKLQDCLFPLSIIVVAIAIAYGTQVFEARGVCLMKGYARSMHSNTHIFCIENGKVQETIPKKTHTDTPE